MFFKETNIVQAALQILGLTRESFGRFRNVFITEGMIAVYTRCGGGNRESYGEMFNRMREHPLYLRDRDDDFDCTYATIFFSIPEKYEKMLALFDMGEFDPNKMWTDKLEKIEKGELTEEEKVNMEQLMKTISEVVESGESGIIEI